MVKSQFLSTCSADSIQKAAEQLKAGHLVAFPTETVYGLGADASNEEAVKRIYEVKGRPTNHPLIIHVSSINGLEVWAQNIPEYAVILARAFWPGPMTLILNRKNIAKDFITGSQDSVGIRVPSDPIALELLSRFETLGGLGIAAPSANRFGQVSPTSSKDVQDEIGRYLSESDLILEGGQSEIGIESTIIDCRNENPIILRPGAITAPMIDSVIEVDLKNPEASEIRVSGNLEKHYAPNAKIKINQTPTAGQAYIALSRYMTPDNVYRISSPANVDEFARNIYASMRKADELGFAELVIEVPEGQGIEIALQDRLRKASNGR
jgi:L-threonylcarbamoyladenylate synthase